MNNMNSEMMISGKWFNRNTGETVQVVNNVIDGDDMVIVTDKGPIKLQDFTEYVQMSDEIYDESGKIIGNEKANYNNMPSPRPKVSIKETKKSKQQFAPPPPQTDDYITQSYKDQSIVSADLIEPEAEPIIEKLVKVNKQVVNESPNYQIISKFFDKVQNKDKLLTISFNNESIPINDLKTIINYMDVTPDEIANYIASNIIEKDYIKNLICNSLSEILKAD